MRPKPPADRLLPARLPFALALRRRPALRRGLALAAAVLVALAVATTVRRAEAARAAWGRAVPVVVATRDLPPGHVLDAEDTRVLEVPAAAAPPGAARQREVRPGGVVRAGAFEGEVLLRRRLAEPGAVGVAAVVPDGARALAVPVEAGSAPPLAVGQLVDVVGVAAGDAGPRAVVLAVGAPVLHVTEGAVTLGVPVARVEVVATALAAGTVTLALVGA